MSPRIMPSTEPAAAPLPGIASDAALRILAGTVEPSIDTPDASHHSQSATAASTASTAELV
ncbi:MAG TPA: hypothetical protein VJN92_09470 [Candidatus Acidoferrum sp.]|nr:hypothetical protein [Candidatus Acidoferrum sp.]